MKSDLFRLQRDTSNPTTGITGALMISWVDSLTIHESATGGRLQNRSLRISTRLLGHSTTAISPGRLMFTNPYVLESRELEER
jgi:hypothetical protein